MPITYPFPLQDITHEIRLKKPWDDSSDRWLTWWYRGVLKNHRAKSQPHVRVVFRKLLGDQVSDETYDQDLLLTSLGKVRIGTVWQDGRCRAKALFEEAKFDLDLVEGKWTHTSFEDTNLYLKSSPFHQEFYPLSHSDDPSQILEFKTTDQVTLLIPCMEYFSRCYGASEEVKRVLATFLQKDCENKLFAPLGMPEEDGIWRIRRRLRTHKDDSVFLAHYKYDDYTRRVSKGIHSQIAAEFDDKICAPVNLKINPWFKGKARVKVRGLWLNNNKTFLALRIAGHSEPEGQPIHVLVEKKKSPPKNAGTEEEDRDRVRVDLVTPPDEIDLTDDDEPNQGGSIVDILSSEFEILGKRRVVIDETKETEGNQQTQFTDDEANAFSTGEPYGSGGDVGYALIHSPQTFVSQGVLREMWEAFLYLHQAYPKQLLSVEWFTFVDGLSKEEELKLIGLEPFHIDEEIDGEIRNWLFLDGAKRQFPRGIFVIRITTPSEYVYVVETQRRWVKKKDKKGKITEGEEPLTGLVFTLKDHSKLGHYLRQILSKVRNAKGIFSKVSGLCPEKGAAFKHSRKSDQRRPEEASARNALSKVMIFL
ncbi:MAG: hypothetical protein CL942_14370 [Desulfovibrio sp.]|nr:hypothetical protein [Desulfovibrio sp.]MBC18223.1 hypothetical protein [Desulfovibrio sp.]|tara:strand:- start:39081 stop:40853 length:1773 start_codon:yes stop_codon:yes gene_type:complete